MMRTVFQKVGNTWMWIALLTMLFVVLAVWLADPLGWADDVDRIPNTVTTSSEWTVRPDGPAVPVDLPDVPVKAVPVDPSSAATSAGA